MTGKTTEIDETYAAPVGSTDDGVSVIRNYKDTVFRMLFSDRRALLNLYNALNGTDYRNEDDLEVNTMENAIYLGRKNDISFVIYGHLNLYEHQSTFNPNMPLRSLLYISSIYAKIVADLEIYSKRKIKLPWPQFVTFYNGTQQQPERQVLKLSELYESMERGIQMEPDLELTVLVININRGYNQMLKDNCRELCNYMEYVDRVRSYAPLLGLKPAVERAVDECIREGILADFLRKNRSEVVAMSIFEYDQEKHLKMLAEESREDGLEAGIEIGMARGKAEGKAEALLEILCDLGPVSEALKKRIMAESDLDVLRCWLKLAVTAGSVEVFEENVLNG